MAKKKVENDEFFPEEFMTDEEIDELYRPKKCNKRKSMAPLFVYFILKQRSSEEHPLRQQDILNILEERPYEIQLERKALSRILHNLCDMTDIFYVNREREGVWM
ncbi:MAG: hypothetical protein IKU26_06020 [Clostridia bacterium]|nr:hypothetical protein [Clostridia bacterium]